MFRCVRVGLAIFAGVGLLSMSSCMMVSGGTGGSGGTSPGYLFGGGNSRSSGSSSSASQSSFSSSSNGGAGSSASYASSSGSGNSNAAVPPGYSADHSESGALTNYLQSHRLPLVGAQVLTNDSGSRQVILYGFVATDFGKQDAAGKARGFLHDPGLAVINRIAVRPELLAKGSGGMPPSPSSPPALSSGTYTYNGGNLGGVQSYENQAQTQQYMQNQGSGLSALMPLIGMLGMMSMGGGGIGIGGGGYGPMYGSPYGSPYGAPYGTPYGGSPYGSPYAPGYGTFGGYGGGFTFP